MRTTFNAGHDHEIIGRQTTVDAGHSHSIPVASNVTSFNTAPGGIKHRHNILGKSPTGERKKTGPRPPRY